MLGVGIRYACTTNAVRRRAAKTASRQAWRYDFQAACGALRGPTFLNLTDGCNIRAYSPLALWYRTHLGAALCAAEASATLCQKKTPSFGDGVEAMISPEGQLSRFT